MLGPVVNQRKQKDQDGEYDQSAQHAPSFLLLARLVNALPVRQRARRGSGKCWSLRRRRPSRRDKAVGLRPGKRRLIRSRHVGHALFRPFVHEVVNAQLKVWPMKLRR